MSVSQILRTYGRQFTPFRALKSAGTDKDIVVQLNDSGATFDEIADYLDRIGS
jgi:hypothetical protein